MENNRIVERLIRYYPASTIANDIISELIKKDGEISISADRIKLLEGQVKQLREALRRIKVSYEDIETANKMISDLKDSLRLNANTVMSLTTKLYAMHDAITALMDNSEEFEFDDGIGRGAQQRYWDEVNEAINEADPPIPADKVLVPRIATKEMWDAVWDCIPDTAKKKLSIADIHQMFHVFHDAYLIAASEEGI